MSQPNILFMLTDDLGWRDLSCYGSTYYETPHLDRLASRGMQFTNAYAACPVCSPTRASIMSGKYPANVGVTDWINWGGGLHPCRGRLIDAPYVDHLPETEISIAKTLRAGGYQTWHVGKWHLGGEQHWPQEHGFDINIGGSERGAPRTYFSPWQLPGLEDAEPGTYLDDYLVDKACELIVKHGADRPFFLNMWFYLVHTPLQAPEHLVEKYREKAKRMKLDQIDPFLKGEVYPAEHKYKWVVTRRVIQSDPVYAAMIECLDTNVGKLMSALQQAGVADNTAVMFTSDNGGLSTSEGSPTCNFPLIEGKGWMYEGGTREPLLISWPGKTLAGSQSDAVVTSPDFYPTMLDIAGLPREPEQHQDGVSFADVLQGKAASVDREAVYWHYPHYGNQGGTPGASVRMGDWKLIEFFEDNRLELYNLADDISETRNLVLTEGGRAAKMQAMVKDWQQTCNARMPEPNPDYVAPTHPDAAGDV